MSACTSEIFILLVVSEYYFNSTVSWSISSNVKSKPIKRIDIHLEYSNVISYESNSSISIYWIPVFKIYYLDSFPSVRRRLSWCECSSSISNRSFAFYCKYRSVCSCDRNYCVPKISAKDEFSYPCGSCRVEYCVGDWLSCHGLR